MKTETPNVDTVKDFYKGKSDSHLDNPSGNNALQEAQEYPQNRVLLLDCYGLRGDRKEHRSEVATQTRSVAQPVVPPSPCGAAASGSIRMTESID